VKCGNELCKCAIDPISSSNSGQSQWPRDLGHELSSLARKLGSWVDVCVRLFGVCVVLCVGTAWRLVDHSSKESYRLCMDQETEKKAKIQKKDCRVIDR
jgi:hypothetical protein